MDCFLIFFIQLCIYLFRFNQHKKNKDIISKYNTDDTEIMYNNPRLKKTLLLMKTLKHFDKYRLAVVNEL